MRADFRDIRITDIRGNALNFCRVSYTAFTTAAIWVKLPAYDKKIFLFYGNGGAASASNGDNTFEFFDDFKTGTVINGNKWDVYGTAVISGGALKLGGTSSTSRHITSKLTFGEGYRVIARAKLEQMAGQFNGVGFIYINSGHDMSRGVNYCTYQNAPKTSLMYNTYTDRTLTTNYTSAFHTFDLTRKGGGASRLIVDGATVINNQTGSYTTALNVGARNYDANKYLYLDYCFVVKYAAVETTLSLGQKYITQQKGYPFSNSITINSTGSLTPGLSITDYTSAAAGLGLHAGYSVMKLLFRRPEPRGPYRAWNYRADIKVTNPSLINGVVSLLNFNYLPGMRGDFRDIRITDLNFKDLPFRLTTAISFVNVGLHVKIPANTTKFYMFYGNGQAVSKSDIATVYELLDTFLGSSLDPALWTSGLGGNGAISIANSIIRMSGAAGSAQIISKAVYDYPVKVVINFSVADVAANSRHRLSLGAEEFDYGIFDGKIYFNGYTGVTVTAGTTYFLNLYWAPNNIFIFEFTDASGAILYTNSVSQAGISSRSLRIQTGDYPGGTVHGDISIPYIYIMKWDPATTPVLSPVRHYPQQLPLYQYSEEIAVSSGLGLQAQDAVFTEYRELKDFALITTNIKKSIQDIYWSLSSDFADDIVPARGSTIKFYAYDSLGNSDFLFIGKAISTAPTLSWLGDTVKLDAADRAQGLAIQKIPWDARVLTLGGSFVGWDTWINYLVNYSVNDLTPGVINRPDMPTTQITLDPKNTRLEAIKKIADYCNYIFFTKWINTGTLQAPNWKTGVYFLHPADIDLGVGGLDLPEPITLTYPDPSLIDLPAISPDLENNYNTVTIYGTSSVTGLFNVGTVCIPEVVTGAELMREYVLEDNLIDEKCSTDEIEAVKWLNYFTSRQATIKVKFVNRFDLQLYQRLRFGAGFSDQLQGLTNMAPLSYVRYYDPRDPSNYRDDDMTGVPRPAWLRITDISYNCGPEENITEVTLMPDFIYSNADPYLEPEWSQYIGNGYLKPLISDSTSTTQSLIDNTVSKQAGPEEGTIMSISDDGKTAEVLTKDGKTVTVNII